MPRYTSFLLRVWCSSRGGGAQWSARLEDLQQSRCEQFTSADALLAHLRLLLDPDARNGPDPPRPGDHPPA